MEKLCIIYVTATNKEEALRIGKSLVLKRLAACINVLDNMTSFYRWEGKEEESNEAVLIVKTRQELFSKVEEEVKALHSYSSPCVVSIPFTDAASDYANWIIKETA